MRIIRNLNMYLHKIGKRFHKLLLITLIIFTVFVLTLSIIYIHNKA